MSAENIYWGPDGPQPISPLSFLSLRRYILDRAQALFGMFLPEAAFTWSTSEIQEGNVTISLTPLAGNGFSPVAITIPVIELGRLLGPLVTERTMAFMSRPTAAQVVERLNEIVGLDLLRPGHFLVEGLDYTAYPAVITMRPSTTNPFCNGVLTTRVTETPAIPTDGLGYTTEGYSVNRETVVEMCIVGSNEPLDISDSTGSRTSYSDGSYIDRIAPDMIEIRAGMLRNYWVRVLIPGHKPVKPVGQPPRQVNVALELVAMSEGQITYHIDSPYPSELLGRATDVGHSVSANFQAFLGFNFNALEGDPQGVPSAYLQTARVRIRLFKE